MVSIIMGTYNGEKTIGRAIESILAQTYTDFEFIICDDKSTDNTICVLKKYAAIDDRIVLLRNDENLGLAASLNNCIAVSKGDYIARMDDDDISHPERIERQFSFMENNSKYAVVGTSIRYFDEHGVWGNVIHSGERTLIDIYCGRTFAHPSVMMRRSALEKVGRYTVSSLTTRGEDYDLWCKMYYEGFSGCNIPEILLDYHESKYSVRRRKFKYRVDGYKMRLNWRRKFGLPKRYDLFAYKELIAGMAPKVLMLYRRKRIVDKYVDSIV
jgi:glycosyltransferase EpsE